ncbi:MAG: class I SAM-dependent methyltransferase [Acidobacteria bacterium]|nr:class I SAM-dependent methyltransferase [Acidobacteriota bacterium]
MTPRRPYSLLARYYDQLTRGAPRMNRLAREKVLRGILPRVRTVCDLGCGTGTAAIELARRRRRVYALDFSPEMVRLARRKVRRLPLRLRSRLHLRRADIRAFRLPERVELVTCEFATLNHVPHKSDLALVCRAVARALRPGGWFLFDINTPKGFAEQTPGGHWVDRRDFKLVMHGHWDARRSLCALDLEWFLPARSAGGPRGRLWRHMHERVNHVAWSNAELRRTLRRAGFRRLRVWDGVDVRPPMPGARRGYDTYYLAQKPQQRSQR